MDDTGVQLLRDFGGGAVEAQRALPRPQAVAVGPSGSPIAAGQDDGLIQLYNPEDLTRLVGRLSLGPYPAWRRPMTATSWCWQARRPWRGSTCANGIGSPRHAPSRAPAEQERVDAIPA
jgi:hypothetical protein